VIGFASSMSVIGWGILSGISLLLFAMVWLRWWRWGYFFDERFVYIRKGFFGVNYYVFPIEKTQQVSFSQSLFMRRGKIADLRYVLASGAHKVPLIPEQLAKAQVDEALLVVARDKPAWM
jgi:putative membrane protein